MRRAAFKINLYMVFPIFIFYSLRTNSTHAHTSMFPLQHAIYLCTTDDRNHLPLPPHPHCIPYYIHVHSCADRFLASGLCSYLSVAIFTLPNSKINPHQFIYIQRPCLHAHPYIRNSYTYVCVSFHCSCYRSPSSLHCHIYFASVSSFPYPTSNTFV